MKINPSSQSSSHAFEWDSILLQDNKIKEADDNIISERKKTSFPCDRFHHAACSQGKYVYILGGKDRYSPLKDFWKLDIVRRKWDKIDEKKCSIPHLEGHTMVSYKTSILIFGGTFCENCEETPLWIYNTDLNCLRKWNEPNSRQPGGRREHSAVIFKNSMYIYGGFLDSFGSTDEFWQFSLEEEVWQQIPRCQPGKRHGHVAVVTSHNMWLHGGMKELTALADLWVFNFNLSTWTKIKGQGLSPTLANHTGHIHNNWLILLGESSSGHQPNRVWLFALDTQIWKQVSTPEVIYPSLSLHTSVLLKRSTLQNQDVDQVKSLPMLTSTSFVGPCDNVRPRTSPAINDNVDKSTRAHFDNDFKSSHFSADILKLDHLHSQCKSKEDIFEEFSQVSEAETSFIEKISDITLKDTQHCRLAKKNLKPVSSEQIPDNLPLLKNFQSVHLDDDLGFNNLCLNISDELTHMSHNSDVTCTSQSDRSNKKFVAKTFLHESKKITEKHTAKTSLIKKVSMHKVNKTFPINLKNQPKTSELLSNQFENPIFSMLCYHSNNVRLQDKRISPSVKVGSHAKDDLYIEDLECIEHDNIFSAFIDPSKSRMKSSSLKDISNVSHHHQYNHYSAARINRLNSNSCDTLHSSHLNTFPTHTFKDLTVWDKDKKIKTDNTIRFQRNSNEENCKENYSTTTHNYPSKCYQFQNSVGIQTSESLQTLNKPQAQAAENPETLTTVMPAFTTNINLATEDNCNILGDSEMCIIVLGGQTEHVTFKSQPMTLWKCYLS